MNFIQDKNGFSLIEVLVALVVASVIVVGIFKLFSDFIFIRKYFYSRKDRIEALTKLVLLIQADIRAKTGKFTLKRDNMGNVYLSFNTTHSLLFDNAFPVRVTYFVQEKENGKKTLYRIEEQKDTHIKVKIPLSENIEDVKFKFFYQNRWQENLSDIIKVSLKIWDKIYTFSQRSMLFER